MLRSCRYSGTTWSATSAPPQVRPWTCRANDASALPTWEWRLGWWRSRCWRCGSECPRALRSTRFLRRLLREWDSQINRSLVIVIQVRSARTVVAGGRFRSAALQIHNGFIGVTPGVGNGNAYQQDADKPAAETRTAYGCRHACFSSAYDAVSLHPNPL